MKFMNMKRFGSIAMAGALALSLTVPAFATSNTQTAITGTYADIPIAVDVPSTGTAQINPYGLPVTLTKSDGKTVSLVGQQITTQPLNIKNQGTVKLDVGVSSFMVVPKAGGGLSVDSTAADTDKQIQVNLEVVGLNDAALALASDAEKLPDLLIDKFADPDSWTNAQVLAAPDAAKTDTATNITAAKSTSAMAVLGAVTPKTEGYTYGANSIALFRLTGDLAEEPMTPAAGGSGDPTPNPWTTDDGFTATIVFKFTPHADVAASISLDKTNATLANAATDTLTATFAPGDSGLTVTSWAWSTSSAVTVDVTKNDSPNATIEWKGSGSATITVTATLSDNSTVTATCAVTAS